MEPVFLPDPKAVPLGEIRPDRFWDEVSEKTERSRTLFQATLELTYSCNLRCIHCYNPTHIAKKNEMPTETIFSILEQLRKEGCLVLILTGGEMFTRRDFFDLLRGAKEEGFAVILQTNGTFLTKERVEQLQTFLPLEVHVSLYGATKETYERVTRIPGSFSKCLAGIEQLVEKKIPVTLKIAAMTLNAEELEKMQAMARSWGIPSLTSVVIHPKSDGSLEPLAYRLDPAKAATILQGPSPLVYQRPKPEEEKRRWKGRMGCKAALNSCAITPYGEMNFCVSFPFPKYNLLTGTVREGWRYLLGWFDSHAGATPPDGENPPPPYRGCPRDGWGECGDFDAIVPYYEALAFAEEHLGQTPS